MIDQSTSQNVPAAIPKGQGVPGYLAHLTNKSPRYWRETLYGYVMASPWLVGFFLLTAIPMILSLYYSFTYYRITTPPQWVGLENYRVLFLHDPKFTQSLYNTVYYVLGSVPLSIVIALFLAVLMNQPVPGRNVFRTIYYLPSVVSGVASAMLWLWIFNPRLGLINSLLGLVGIKGPSWIFSYEWAKPAMILMNMWTVGGTMVIFLAGLQDIPVQLTEAAEIDGANAWQRFWGITIPLLSPAIFFNVITRIIGSFQIFTEVYVWTHRHDPSGGGAGPRDSLLFYVLYLFNRAFGEMRMGYASAMAWILFVIILVLTLIQFRLAERWVYYESGT